MAPGMREQVKRDRDDAITALRRIENGDMRIYVAAENGSVSTVHTLLDESQLWKLENIITAWLRQLIKDANTELEENT